ncbi:hypothetical protein ATANTOWER_028139 [Ataeniobius toweri]|uniref:Uncharacterized protein n=1 Tax=Ataeniobius toweri TaxID=208326 RepID=A0ABU7BIZ6_9TELE|nr:hypothetical protein [Ataeniobius toweri]
MSASSAHLKEILCKPQRWSQQFLKNSDQPTWSQTRTGQERHNMQMSPWRTGSRGRQTQQRHPDVPLPRHLLQLPREKPKAFPDQPGDIVPPACLGLSPGPPFQWVVPGTPPEEGVQEASGIDA